MEITEGGGVLMTDFRIEKVSDNLFELKHPNGLTILINYDEPCWLLDKGDMQDLAKQIKELGF